MDTHETGVIEIPGSSPTPPVHPDPLARPQSRAAAVAAFLAKLGLFEVVFYFAYTYSMAFSAACASPFWIPDSVLVCTLLLTPPKRWWIYVLAPLPIRLTASVLADRPLWFLLATFANDSIKALIMTIALRKVLRNPIRIETIKEYSLFYLIAVVLVPAASAFAGAAARQALGYAFWPAWEQWYLGDALAQLIITPAVLYWVAGWRHGLPVLTSKQWLEIAGVTVGLIFAGYLAFGTGTATSFTEARFYAPVPILFWAAIRFGMFGASGAVGLLTIQSVYAAIRGVGPFSGQSPRDTALALQAFLLLRAAPLYLVAVLIEQMKRSDLELRQNRAALAHASRISVMGELSASLAHELSQPLTAIQINAQAAQRYMDAKPFESEGNVRDILKDIVHDDFRAGEVIRRMRSLLKKETPSFVRVDLSAVIDDVVALLHADAIQRNVRVTAAVSDRLPAVQGDKIQLQQVALNLLLNAFEALRLCPVGDRRVMIDARLNQAGMVEVSVRDNGVGLKAEQLDKIFESFYTTRREGLGMGLSISRSIIESHGGKIWANPNPDPDCGVTFYFTLQVAK